MPPKPPLEKEVVDCPFFFSCQLPLIGLWLALHCTPMLHCRSHCIVCERETLDEKNSGGWIKMDSHPSTSNATQEIPAQPWPLLSKYMTLDINASSEKAYVFTCELCKPKLNKISTSKVSNSNLWTHLKVSACVSVTFMFKLFLYLWIFCKLTSL